MLTLLNSVRERIVEFHYAITTESSMVKLILYICQEGVEAWQDKAQFLDVLLPPFLTLTMIKLAAGKITN